MICFDPFRNEVIRAMNLGNKLGEEVASELLYILRAKDDMAGAEEGLDDSTIDSPHLACRQGLQLVSFITKCMFVEKLASIHREATRLTVVRTGPKIQYPDDILLTYVKSHSLASRLREPSWFPWKFVILDPSSLDEEFNPLSDRVRPLFRKKGLEWLTSNPNPYNLSLRPQQNLLVVTSMNLHIAWVGQLWLVNQNLASQWAAKGAIGDAKEIST